ncbi:MAG: aminomethyl-transferring glycine dehydrogenase subunit GcvPB, partial [Candidatus Bipolaricaulota bacterium]
MRTAYERPSTAEPSSFVPPAGMSRGKADALPPSLARRRPLRLPSLREPELVRHYTGLSKLNYGVDDGFYPLGSCTMKYNPKQAEDLAALPQWINLHPSANDEDAQGMLRLLHHLSELLGRVAGLPGVSLQPAAGAHGELAGLMLFKRWFERRGEAQRTRILLPDSSHGTNPASAAVAGFTTTTIASNANGQVD